MRKDHVMNEKLNHLAIKNIVFYLAGLLIAVAEAYVITDFTLSDELVRNA